MEKSSKCHFRVRTECLFLEQWLLRSYNGGMGGGGDYLLNSYKKIFKESEV